MAPIKPFAAKLAKAAFTASAHRRHRSSSSNNSIATDRGLLPTTTAAAAVSSPLLRSPTPTAEQGGSPSSSFAGDASSSFSLERMCRLFDATPVDSLYLSAGGERGVCLRKPVNEGDVVLSVPIASCFRDDEPPGWYDDGAGTAEGADYEEHDITDYERYNPSAWASRLAASVLDTDLRPNDDDDGLAVGREIWRSALPDADALRSSLPVHWGEAVLGTCKCTALELAVDSAYFARAGAVANLSEELQRALDAREERTRGRAGDDEELLRRKCDADALDVALDMEILQRQCHDALDIVQTRACRVERRCEDGVQWGPPLRVLAPIFDFINHGSSRGKGEGSANASFGIEGERMCDMHDARLVVRAARDIAEGEEVLIDYGDSARPAWRCLTSYGFVPEYDVASESEEDGQNAENVAELWMNGLRYEVDPSSVPFDLVEVASAQAMLDRSPSAGDDEDRTTGGGVALTPSVARAIARRATEAAFNLITEPEMVDSEEDWDSPELVRAASLAWQLRWSQHRVLLTFAENLELFSSEAAA